jgi:uncharacterized cupin superfamily protein
MTDKVIKLEKPSRKKVNEMRIISWPIWEEGISTFQWYYEHTETCYILEGQARVIPDSGSPVEFGPGHLVKFPKGTDCTWEIFKPVVKRYKFGD